MPELIQNRATAAGIAAEAAGVLDNPERLEAMREDLSGLRRALGESGASRRAAAEVRRFLTGEAS